MHYFFVLISFAVLFKFFFKDKKRIQCTNKQLETLYIEFEVKKYKEYDILKWFK